MPSTIAPRDGDVWYVNFDPQVGREQGGIRPALVISNDEFNAVRNGLVFIVPITTRDRGWSTHVRVDPPDGGLTKTSFILCEQAKSQSIDRCMSRRGNLSTATVDEVRRIVGRFINAHRLFD